MRKQAATLAVALLVATALVPGAAVADRAAEDTPVAGTWVNSTVTIVTNFGTIVAMLYDEGAPVTVENFLDLATSGFYDGIRFHRIVDDFVIQTGDPNTKDSNPYNDGTGGSSQTIPLETDENLTHVDGALGMARSNDPDSASSQFYICDGPQNGLDGNYAVFGVVVQGIEVVRQIASQPVWGLKRPAIQQQPISDIIMESVTAEFGYEQPAEPGAGGGGGILDDIAWLGGGDSEFGASILAIIVIALIGAFSVASFRRGAWRILGSYGSDVRRVPIARRGLAGTRDFTRRVGAGARKSIAIARMGLPRRR